jgi:hypothetical protein
MSIGPHKGFTGGRAIAYAPPGQRYNVGHQGGDRLDNCRGFARTCLTILACALFCPAGALAQDAELELGSDPLTTAVRS